MEKWTLKTVVMFIFWELCVCVYEGTLLHRCCGASIGHCKAQYQGCLKTEVLLCVCVHTYILPHYISLATYPPTIPHQPVNCLSLFLPLSTGWCSSLPVITSSLHSTVQPPLLYHLTIPHSFSLCVFFCSPSCTFKAHLETSPYPPLSLFSIPSLILPLSQWGF